MAMGRHSRDNHDKNEINICLWLHTTNVVEWKQISLFAALYIFYSTFTTPHEFQIL